MKTAIVIPIYKPDLDQYEYISFVQVCKVLKNYPIILVCPIGLDLKVYFDIYPKLLVEYFDKYYPGWSAFVMRSFLHRRLKRHLRSKNTLDELNILKY